MSLPRVLIAGSGDLGRRIAARLREAGASVVSIARRPRPDEPDLIALDLTQPVAVRLPDAFDDATCVRLMRQLRAAMGDSGARAAVLEMVVPETGADVASASFDMQMFVGCRGRERTLNEWKSLIQAGGLALEEVVRLRSLGSILVLRST